MIEKYYEEELRYLYESGKEFSKTHPDIAAFLNIDAIGDRDPNVERLFEGFAFLTARIREKIDDSLPEVTEGLTNLLWPQFQQEVPSLCVVEFKPRRGHLQQARILPKGSELLTRPLGPESISCSFTTTQDVNLNPIFLSSINKEVDHQGRGTLRLNFQIEQGVKFENLLLNPLKLYLHAEMPTAMAIHDLMTNHVTRAEVTLDTSGSHFSLDPSEAVTAGGFSKNELLIPTSSNSLTGYALLLEYFIFPEKFMYINLYGLDHITIPEKTPSVFSLSYSFDCGFPTSKVIETSTFRLSCTPAINLFQKSTEPLINTGKRTEYQIRADSNNSTSVTHSLISVVGTDVKTGERISYEPVHKAIGKTFPRTFSTHYRMGFQGKRELYIMIANDQIREYELREEILSIDAWCTNGILPREEMSEGCLSIPGPKIPDFVTFTNITRPTPQVYPPSDKNYLWVLFSHLNATYHSFSSAEVLRSFLHQYNWSQAKGPAERIGAICDISLDPFEAIKSGVLLRGVRFTVSVQERKFADSGDLHLFGEVLMIFFSNYVSINSFLELVIITKPSEHRFRWNSLKGKKWPI